METHSRNKVAHSSPHICGSTRFSGDIEPLLPPKYATVDVHQLFSGVPHLRSPTPHPKQTFELIENLFR